MPSHTADGGRAKCEEELSEYTVWEESGRSLVNVMDEHCGARIRSVEDRF